MYQDRDGQWNIVRCIHTHTHTHTRVLNPTMMECGNSRDATFFVNSTDACAFHAKHRANGKGFCMSGYACTVVMTDLKPLLAGAATADTCDKTTRTGTHVYVCMCVCVCVFM